MGPAESSIEAAYRLAHERFSALGVDVDAAVRILGGISVSLHCWQGDDVGGFDGGGAPGGGLAVTGNYPGRARTPDELRSDAAKALSLIPGQHRFNLHAMYAETGGHVERDELGPDHFGRWIDWAKSLGLGLDFNPTFFAHPRAAGGLTLTSPDEEIRRYWVRHGAACRRIGAEFGRRLGSACVTNIWIPDGQKDTPADRGGPRERLLRSLDEILGEPVDPSVHRDSVESKLFGIGTESYVAGSHEFYLGYAAARGIMLCLDTGHYHPTESVGDKVSAVLQWVPEILLHVSRGVRWDSDHVVTLTDELRSLADAVIHGGYVDRVRFGLDYFDASINRLAAWVIGARSLLKALLAALLTPIDRLREAEAAGDYAARLALQEEAKTLPLGAVWDCFCLRKSVPVGTAWLDDVRAYEREVMAAR